MLEHSNAGSRRDHRLLASGTREGSGRVTMTTFVVQNGAMRPPTGRKHTKHEEGALANL